MIEKKYKLAFISAAPFYYQVPLYKHLVKKPEIELQVYFCSNETVNGSMGKKMYGIDANITKDDLLSGYKYEFLRNYSPTPSFFSKPFGLLNFDIWNRIKNGKYDAVVLQAWDNAVWLISFFACLRFGSKIFFMTDSNILEESSKGKMKRIFKKLFLGKFLFYLSNGFLTSGKANEMFYQYYGVNAKKMFKLPFSFGYEDLIKKSEKLLSQRENMRKLLNISQDDFVILYVGRLAKEKSIQTLLGAYKHVGNENKKMIIVGSGPERKKIDELIENLNLKNIQVVGFKERKEVFNFYCACDVLVLPSKRETWGIVVSEAMCFNLPVIVSDRVGCSLDLVKNNDNGFIFRFPDSKDLAIKIKTLINLPKSQLLLFRERSKSIMQLWTKDSLKQIDNLSKAFND